MLKIALGQIEVIPGRPDLNSNKILSFINHARTFHADIVIFPELSVPGYFLGDVWEQPSFIRDCEYWGQKIIEASKDICVIFGNIAVDHSKVGNDGRIRKFNACFIAQNGKLIYDQARPYPYNIKILHPNYREFDDSRHFYSLRKIALELNEPLDKLISPIKLTIRGKEYKLGCLICEDGWNDDYEINPTKILAEQGIDLFINISCSPFSLGKNEKRHKIFASHAKNNKIPIVYVNNIGIQNVGKTVFVFDGSSCIYNIDGNIYKQCLSFTEECKLLDLDLNSNNYEGFVETDSSSSAMIYKALIFGINKFLKSINMEKMVIGLSGGIDSAVSAALYTQVLGPDNVLLINMPSRFNSLTTINLAEKLASNLDCPYSVIPIEEAVNHTIAQLEGLAKLTVSDFAKENIQARDRSARILAGAAACFGGGFTCNSNKSELTVGYATFYGDLGGVLAALADLWKHQVYQLGHYINKKVYKREVIPNEIFNLPPCAELSSAQNIDLNLGDPIIYPYHDFLFKSFVEHWNRATPEDILDWYIQGTLEQNIGCETGIINKIFSSPQSFIEDLEYWWKMYTTIGVAKRIQAPPVLAVSRRAFGFDHREAQLPLYFTTRYHHLKDQLIKQKHR